MEATVLLSKADVANAPPGLYITQSGTDAYFPALALVESAVADLVGEAFTAAGHIVTLQIHKRKLVLENPPETEKRTIRIGGEFFLTALKDYDDWPVKWWREVVQNAVDAGATNVTLGSRANEDQTITVWCDDDGRGMDEDIILNKFLVLGATTKTSTSGTAGGFGKAKELLLLPWIKWKIHSRETLVEGAGIDYSASTVAARTGTRLEVVMPNTSAKDHTDAPIAFGFVEKCNLPHVRFTIDGDNPPDTKKIFPKTIYASLAGGNIIEEVPGKAAVYFIPSQDETSSNFIVRTKGLFMFQEWVSERIPGRLIVELLAPSIEILTANRDGFRDWEVKNALRRLAERIAINKMSALKSSKGMIRKKYEGSGKFEAKARTAMMLDHVGPVASGPLPSQTVGTVIELIGQMGQTQQENTPSAMAPKGVAEIMLDQKFLGSDHLEAALKQLVWQPDFYIVNDIEGYKVPKKFYPETMTPTVLKLAKVWVELCRYVLVQLGSSRQYGVGFHFDTTLAASYIRDGEEEWLMLNPHRDMRERKEIWRTTDADLKWLYAAAIHECTHMVDRLADHDEPFSSALTRNMAKCADGYRKIRQIAAGIKMRGAPELAPKKSAGTMPKNVADLTEDERDLFRRIAERNLEGRGTWIQLEDVGRASILRGAGFITVEGEPGEQIAKLTGKGERQAVEVTG